MIRSPNSDEPLPTDPAPAGGTPGFDLAPGTTLGGGRFVVRDVLGRGGFGITYGTDDRRLERRVAVKELFPDGAVRHGDRVGVADHARGAFEAARDRFLREARVLARFTHPGIVRVYEVFEANDTAYLVMELLEGRTLAAVLTERGGPLAEPEVLDVAARAAGALSQVHEAGVLHRDLNPSNLVLTDHGRVVLIDFGIARDFEASGHTGTMTRVVTPGYAPPEQYAGQARFGPATDVYGLSATLYRLLTAQAPTPAVERQQGAELAAPHRLVPSVSAATSAAVLDGLELNPAHRPQTLERFTARLGLAGEPRSSRALLVSGEHAPSRPAATPPSDATLAPTGAEPVAATAAPPSPPDLDATRASAARYDGPGTAYAPGPPSYPHPSPPPRWDAAPAPDPLDGTWRPGRWKLTLPVGVGSVALASAAPVVVMVLAVVAVLPALATAGDVLVARRHSAGRRFYAGAMVPLRAVRNIGWSLLRGLPALGVGVVLVAIAVAVDQLEGPVAARDAIVRAAGVLTMVLVGRPALDPDRRFRAAAVTDVVLQGVVDAGGRLQPRGWWVWFGGLVATALGLYWQPELWPLPV